MKKEKILNGFRIGEYSMSDKEFYETFEQKYAEGMNYVSISLNQAKEPVTQENFIEWAKFLADKKMYFYFTGGGNRAEAGFTDETVKKMKEIAGDYFFGYYMGETGSSFSCKGSGYSENPHIVYDDLQQAKDMYVNRVAKYAKGNSKGDTLNTSVVESTAMVTYNCEAGITFPSMEIWPGDVEIATAYTRGAVKAYNCPGWEAYMAHEFYGGLRYDAIREKRFKMGYEFSYLAGATYFITESGDEMAGFHAEYTQEYPEGQTVDEMISRCAFGYDHPVCQNYRKVMRDFAKFTTEDIRPAGGPKVRVAFVRGNLDGSSFRHSGGSLWRGHLQKEYGYGPAEFSWRILEDLQRKRRWCDVHNYGDVDTSGAPGYGLYDVIPADVGADIFCKYDYLIFVGWNSMTQEIYDNLKEFVKKGGRLFMMAAHLNTSIQRDGSISLINGGDVSDLFGCTLDAENIVCKDEGSKFCKSIVPELMYPSLHFECGDPYFAEGYITYAGTKLTGGVAAARLSNKFVDRDIDAMPISLVENKVGEGYALLMTNLEYPFGAAVPMYTTLVREILAASHRSADIKVYGNDSIRFSVYEGGKVYLLNTDFDNPAKVTIDYGTKKKEFILEPCEFKPVEND